VDEGGRARLVAVLTSYGARTLDGPSARLLDAPADQGVFRASGVLVGSHAFAAYGIMSGLVWSNHWRTEDIDLAAPRRLHVAVDERADLRTALEATGLQFDAVPMLEVRRPSTLKVPQMCTRGRGQRLWPILSARNWQLWSPGGHVTCSPSKATPH
jgi:hypothetical protein